MFLHISPVSINKNYFKKSTLHRTLFYHSLIVQHRLQKHKRLLLHTAVHLRAAWPHSNCSDCLKSNLKNSQVVMRKRSNKLRTPAAAAPTSSNYSLVLLLDSLNCVLNLNLTKTSSKKANQRCYFPVSVCMTHCSLTLKLHISFIRPQTKPKKEATWSEPQQAWWTLHLCIAVTKEDLIYWGGSAKIVAKGKVCLNKYLP